MIFVKNTKCIGFPSRIFAKLYVGTLVQLSKKLLVYSITVNTVCTVVKLVHGIGSETNFLNPLIHHSNMSSLLFWRSLGLVVLYDPRIGNLKIRAGHSLTQFQGKQKKITAFHIINIVSKLHCRNDALSLVATLKMVARPALQKISIWFPIP